MKNIINISEDNYQNNLKKKNSFLKILIGLMNIGF